METFRLIIFLVFFIGTFFLIFKVLFKVANRPKAFKRKIDAMGNPIGKTYQSIVDALGRNPIERSVAEEGYCVTWREVTNSYYWIVFSAVFDPNDICCDYQVDLSGNKW